jgi:PAS domain S-box-containing protein
MSATAAEKRLRAFLDGVCREHLGPAVGVLTGFFTIVVLAYGWLQAGPFDGVLVAAAMGSALALLAGYLALGRAPLWAAQPVAAALAALAVGNACLYLGTTHDGRAIAGFCVIPLACAWLFLSRRWLSVTFSGAAASLAATAAWTLPSSEWGAASAMLLVAFALGGMIHETRFRAYRRFGEATLADEEVRAGLEGALGALRREEERLRPLAESSAEGVVIHRSGEIVDTNRAALQMLGRSAAEIVGHTLSELLSRESGSVPAAPQAVGKPFEATVLRPDGTSLAVEVSTGTVSIDGHLASVISLRDVEERRRERALLVARRSLEHLVTTIAAELARLPPAEMDRGIGRAVEAIARLIGAEHGAVMRFDAEGAMWPTCEWLAEGVPPVRAIRALEDGGLTEGTPWIVRRMTALEAVHVPDVGDLPPQAAVDKIFLEERSVRSLIVVPIAHGDQLLGALSLATLRDARAWSDEIIGLLRIVAEIMASAFMRQRALKELETSEARKAAILEAALDCIITTDERGFIVELNPAAEKTFGHPRLDLIGRPLHDLIVPHPQQSADADDLGMLLGGEGEPVLERRIETRGFRRDGTEFPAELAVVSMQVGSERAFTLYLRDITERMEVERLREELIATVSHELRTPLTSLRGFAELMLEKEFSPARRQKFLGVIRNEAVRLTQLVNDFLDLKRIESGHVTHSFDPIDVRTMLREVELLFHREDGIHEFRLDLDPALTLMSCDAAQIRRALTNLVGNAIKFSPHGGTITLGARNEPEGVLLWVTDEGIGISESAMQGLFQKFYRVNNAETRSIGGTGLGLALTKEIVTAHAGKIWVESSPGSGSTFYMSLPAVPDAAGDDASGGSEPSYAVPRVSGPLAPGAGSGEPIDGR